jgi:alpha-L-fucosidase
MRNFISILILVIVFNNQINAQEDKLTKEERLEWFKEVKLGMTFQEY